VKEGERLEKIEIHQHDVGMKNTTTEPMDTASQFCPNEECCARGKQGAGNIRIHSYDPQRYRCTTCKKTFSARRGTVMEGLRTDEKLVMTVITLLSYGCPRQAIVQAFGLDERTVAEWQKRAGEQCKRVHQAIVEQGHVNSQHIQADEIRAKGRKIIIWMALAIDVTTRLWMAGAVSTRRDRRLTDGLFKHVRLCCAFVADLLVCTDGFAAYPKSIMRAFREKVKKQAGPGRCSLKVWSGLCIATVIKHTKKKRVVKVTRKVTRGTLAKAQELLTMVKGCTAFNTAFIERLNGTFRQRLASLTRKCRHAAAPLETLEQGMYLIGCTYNFCFPHHSLSKPIHFGGCCTPAMAAGLTDHVWSISELLKYKIAPTPYVELKQSKRRKLSTPSTIVQKQPGGQPGLPLLPDQIVSNPPGEVA